MAPTTIANALQDSDISASVAVGHMDEPSPYEIDEISTGINSTGATAVMKNVSNLEIDEKNKIVTSP